MFWLPGYPVLGFVDYMFYKLWIWQKGLDPVYKHDFVEFLIDFLELENLEIVPQVGFWDLVFQMGCDIIIPCGFLIGF